MKKCFLHFLSISCIFFPFFLAAQDAISNKTVLIGSPIRQQPLILKEFLQSLEELNQKDILFYYYFIDDNTNEESIKILQEFAKKHLDNTLIVKAPSGEKSYIPTTHCWTNPVVWKVAAFKDTIIEYTLKKNFDYLFLIDSDILLYPNTVNQLITDNKDIVSEIFWTQWSPGSMKQPQVWLYDTYTQHEFNENEKLSSEEIAKRTYAFFDTLKTPGVYEVGGLGACTLLSKRALQAGINFKKIKNLTFWGEDRHFCIRAAAIGLQLFVDTHYPAYHIYRETALPGVDPFKENCKKGVYQI